MSDTPMQCQRCGQAHAGKAGTSAAGCIGHRRDGDPCGNDAMRGQRVCRMHGGSTPAARAAGVQRQAEAKADAVIADLWPGLSDQIAIKDPVDLLARTAGALEHMAEKVGARVNELQGRIGAGAGLTQLRAEVVLLDRLLDKLLKATDAMARLGIAERRAELDAALAQVIVAAYVESLAGVSLVPADRDALLQGFLRGLGLGDTVAGEVSS